MKRKYILQGVILGASVFWLTGCVAFDEFLFGPPKDNFISGRAPVSGVSEYLNPKIGAFEKNKVETIYLDYIKGDTDRVLFCGTTHYIRATGLETNKISFLDYPSFLIPEKSKKSVFAMGIDKDLQLRISRGRNFEPSLQVFTKDGCYQVNKETLKHNPSSPTSYTYDKYTFKKYNYYDRKAPYFRVHAKRFYPFLKERASLSISSLNEKFEGQVFAGRHLPRKSTIDGKILYNTDFGKSLSLDESSSGGLVLDRYGKPESFLLAAEKKDDASGVKLTFFDEELKLSVFYSPNPYEILVDGVCYFHKDKISSEKLARKATEDQNRALKIIKKAAEDKMEYDAIEKQIPSILSRCKSEALHKGTFSFKGFYLGMNKEDARMLICHYSGEVVGISSDSWTSANLGTDENGKINFFYFSPRLVNKIFNVSGLRGKEFVQEMLDHYDIQTMDGTQDGWEFRDLRRGFQFEIRNDKTMRLFAIQSRRETDFD